MARREGGFSSEDGVQCPRRGVVVIAVSSDRDWGITVGMRVGEKGNGSRVRNTDGES